MRLTQWNFVTRNGFQGAALVRSGLDKFRWMGENRKESEVYVVRGPTLNHTWLAHPMVLAVPENQAPAVHGDPQLAFSSGQVCVRIKWMPPNEGGLPSALDEIRGPSSGLAYLGELLSLFFDTGCELGLNPVGVSVEAESGCCVVQLGEPEEISWTEWADSLLLFAAACEMLIYGRGFQLAECELSRERASAEPIDGSLYMRLSRGDHR
jgi:hypothetical protein